MNYQEQIKIEPDDDLLFSIEESFSEPAHDEQEVQTGRKKRFPKHKKGIFNTLAPYYLVTNQQVFHKIISGLLLRKIPRCTEEQGSATIELYSTFWTIATVIVSLFMSQCSKDFFSDFIKGSRIEDRLEYSSFLIVLLWIFGFFTVAVPLLLKVIVLYTFNKTFSGLELIHWYGLSCVVWVPLAVISFLISFLPKRWVALIEWFLAFLGGAYSFMIIYVQVQDESSGLKERQLVNSIIALMHIVLSFLTKLFVFKSKH